MAWSPRDIAKQKSTRVQNLEDFGVSYSDFEKLALTSLPPWPIVRCVSLRVDGKTRCKNRFGMPGQMLCRRHLGNTMVNRRKAIRRYVTWILCGFPSHDSMAFESLLSEQICHLLEANILSQIPMVDQARFLSAVIEMSGIVESKDLEI